MSATPARDAYLERLRRRLRGEAGPDEPTPPTPISAPTLGLVPLPPPSSPVIAQPSPYSESAPRMAEQLGVVVSELSAGALEKLVTYARRLRDQEAGR